MVLEPVEQGVSGPFGELNTMSLLSRSAQSLCASNKRGAEVRSLKAKGMEVPSRSSSFLLTPWTWERELGITSLLSPSCVQVHQPFLTGLLGWAWELIQCQETADLSILKGKSLVEEAESLLPLGWKRCAIWGNIDHWSGTSGQRVWVFIFFSDCDVQLAF